MELHHEFNVPIPIDQAWDLLSDVERIAPCLPGASVEDFDGERVKGGVKVKVGPVTVTYHGTATFEERDEKTHRMVLAANGREIRGHGTARARVVSTLAYLEDGVTSVAVDTDLKITGRPAQFGRGVMEEVGERLIGQFADCLASELTSPGGEGESDEEAEPIDALRTAGVPVAKRLLAMAAGLGLLALALRAARRRRGTSGRRGVSGRRNASGRRGASRRRQATRAAKASLRKAARSKAALRKARTKARAKARAQAALQKAALKQAAQAARHRRASLRR
ncbi:SRPBCC family protein [Streptomyces boninensis]|uniref:SRPBCC family protein n=1 Tax=Streptomyces boninensis TaxID=2039455 RepID=UPI003B225B83